MLLPVSSRNPGITANASILARNLLERALCTMTGKITTSYSLSAAAIRAGNPHAWALFEVSGGSLQVLTSLLAMAALVLTSGTLGVVFSQFF